MDFSSRSVRYASTYPPNEDLLSWLRKEEPEPVLEPELEIVDPHHHFFFNTHEDFPYKQKIYLLHELLEDIYDGHNVIGTVYVEAKSFRLSSGPKEFKPIGEVEFCQGMAAAAESGLYGPSRDRFSRVCWGIQGTVDLRHPNAEAVLLQMMKCRNFKGVRASGPYDDAFKRGFRILEKHGLVFDRWHSPKPIFDVAELAKLKELALEFPKVTIVLNHLGGAVGPAMGGEDAVARWRDGIADLARSCPNVYCKVGGIQMAINGWKFEERATPIGSTELADLVFPFYDHAILSFGPSRCMFESNFPVEKDSVTYRTLYNMFKRVAARLGLTPSEKQSIFKDTAMRVYSLSEAPMLRSSI